MSFIFPSWNIRLYTPCIAELMQPISIICLVSNKLIGLSRQPCNQVFDVPDIMALLISPDSQCKNLLCPCIYSHAKLQWYLHRIGPVYSPIIVRAGQGSAHTRAINRNNMHLDVGGTLKQLLPDACWNSVRHFC